MTIHSYPTVFALGHKAVTELLSGEIIVEEKVDGSQVSFGITDGVLEMRSKSTQIDLDGPQDMFKKAVSTARDLVPMLTSGWVYRGEYLEKPKHNTLSYSMVPPGNIIIFDVMIGPETYLAPDTKRAEAFRLGLLSVPLLYQGVPLSLDTLKRHLETESCLGGTKIEGIVIKNYNVFTPEKKIAVAKMVRRDFEEVHKEDWRQRNPTNADILIQLIERYRTEARWQKAAQHLRDNGTLQGAPQDIPALMREINEDVLRECEGEIKDILFKHFWKDLSRAVTRGAPEWYKASLAESQQVEAPL